MVRPEEFESPAFWFVAKRSIQLSYGRKLLQAYYKMVRVARFERATPWSQAKCATRLRYTRIKLWCRLFESNEFGWLFRPEL
jgi:hypothetical protein